MFESCNSCAKLGKTCRVPRFITLDSQELLEWCKQRMKFLNMSHAELATRSRVPLGTVDRLFSSDTTKDFKYDTIRPIVMVLAGYSPDEEPCCDTGELDIENKHLSELLEFTKKVENRDAMTIRRMEKIIRTRGIFIYILLSLCALMMVALISYFSVDVVNLNTGYVRDAYVFPMAFVVAAIIGGGIATLVAMLIGIFREKKNRRD